MNTVAPAALAVHRDASIVIVQQFDERAAGELAAYLGRAVSEYCLFDGVGAELGVHRDRTPPKPGPGGCASRDSVCKFDTDSLFFIEEVLLEGCAQAVDAGDTDDHVGDARDHWRRSQR